MKRFRLPLGFCALMVALPAGAVMQYSVESLGTSPEWMDGHPLFGFVNLSAINDQGDVVGSAGTRFGDRGWIWTRNDGVKVLDTLSAGGPNDASANSINNAGQIVGGSSVDGPRIEHAFLYERNGEMQDIALLAGRADSNNRAYGINAGGAVVGLTEFEDTLRGFYWKPDKGMVILGDLPGGDDRSSASAISDRGHVVGSSSASTGTRAFLWTEREGMRDIGDLAGGEGWSVAVDVNERGAVVGSSSASTGERGFYWEEKTGILNLGDLRGGSDWSRAVAVNNHGTVVGYSGSHDGTEAFVWYPGEGMYALEELIHPLDPYFGTNLTSVVDINERGQILVGAGKYWELGFILTPRKPARAGGRQGRALSAQPPTSIGRTNQGGRKSP